MPGGAARPKDKGPSLLARLLRSKRENKRTIAGEARTTLTNLISVQKPQTKVRSAKKRKAKASSKACAGGGVKVVDFGGEKKARSRGALSSRLSAPAPRTHYNHYGECLSEFVLGSEDAAKDDPSQLLVHVQHGASSDF